MKTNCTSRAWRPSKKVFLDDRTGEHLVPELLA